MDKHEYYLLGLKNGWFKDAFWVKSIFSIFHYQDVKFYHYILKNDGKRYYFNNRDAKSDDEKTRIYIDGNYSIKDPLLRPGEKIIVPDGEIINYKGDLITSCGCLLQNYLMTIDPFKGKVEYINKNFSPKHVEKIIIPIWKDIPDKNSITTKEYLQFATNCQHLTNYCQTFIPSITKKALCSNPKLESRKKELYEEHKNELNNPVVVAAIDKELENIDREYLKDDPSIGFLTNKAFSNTRKRLNNHFGAAKGLIDGGSDEFIERPLSEGIDMYRLSTYVNDAYSGSIGRGLETQEGGVEVKNALRSAANLKVDGKDCGTKYGQLIKFSDKESDNKKYLNYWFIEDGNSVEITNDNISSLTGKLVLMRSPSYCVNSKSSYCEKCCGPYISEYPNGIAAVNALPGSRIMGISMKSMHFSVTKTEKWDKNLIS